MSERYKLTLPTTNQTTCHPFTSCIPAKRCPDIDSVWLGVAAAGHVIFAARWKYQPVRDTEIRGCGGAAVFCQHANSYINHVPAQGETSWGRTRLSYHGGCVFRDCGELPSIPATASSPALCATLPLLYNAELSRLLYDIDAKFRQADLAKHSLEHSEGKLQDELLGWAPKTLA